jgi:beta-lactamase class A
MEVSWRTTKTVLAGLYNSRYMAFKKTKTDRPFSYNYYYSQSNTAPVRTPKNHSHRTAVNKRRHRGRWTALAIVLICAAIFQVFVQPASPSRLLSDIKNSFSAKPKPSQQDISSASLSAMGGQINQVIAQNSDIDISVSLIDLQDDQDENYGDPAPFTAASTTKVITALYFLNQVEAGNQSLTESVEGETAQYELQQMIVVSDDDAWNDLINLLGFSNIQVYAHSIGATSFTFNAGTNTLTSSNMASVLQRLWQGKLLDKFHTNLLLGYLKQANYRQYIVAAVPDSDTIYHKVGFYEDFVNDAAIISDGRSSVVEVIFTNGNGEYQWDERAELMQAITKIVLPVYLPIG